MGWTGDRKLPHCEQAWVPRRKLLDYLLSPSHPVGKGKAAFFHQHGFDESSVADLEIGLLAIARSEEAVRMEETPYGQKFTVDGILEAPGGRSVRLRTVWILETGSRAPRFVTAFPG